MTGLRDFGDDRVGANAGESGGLGSVGVVSLAKKVDEGSPRGCESGTEVELGSGSVVAQRACKVRELGAEATLQLGRCQGSPSKDRCRVPGGEKFSPWCKTCSESTSFIRGRLKRGGKVFVALRARGTRGLVGVSEVSREGDDVREFCSMGGYVPQCKAAPKRVAEQVGALREFIEICEQGAVVNRTACAVGGAVEEVRRAIAPPQLGEWRDQAVTTLGKAMKDDQFFISFTQDSQPGDAIWSESDGV